MLKVMQMNRYPKLFIGYLFIINVFYFFCGAQLSHPVGIGRGSKNIYYDFGRVNFLPTSVGEAFRQGN